MVAASSSERQLRGKAQHLQAAARGVHLEAGDVVVDAQRDLRRRLPGEAKAGERLRRRFSRAVDLEIDVVEAGTHGGDAETSGQAPCRREGPAVTGGQAGAAHLELAAELG